MKQFGLWIGATLASALLVFLLWLVVLPFFFELIDGKDAADFPDKYEIGMILPPAPTQAEFAARHLVAATSRVDAATITGRAIKLAVRDAHFATPTLEQDTLEQE